MQDLNYFISQFDLLDFIDIVLVSLVIFGMLMLLQGTRAVQILRGFIVVGLLVILVLIAIDLPALRWLISNTLPALLFAIPVIFHPEIRRLLERLGRTGQYFRFWRRQQHDNPLISAVTNACQRLSQRHDGALIIFERDTGLQEYIDTGVPLDATPSPELLLTIFAKNTELHDGAVIVRAERIAAAACVMPLSSSVMDSTLGLRHRAALGTSEVSDAVAVIVSEETGRISFAHNGRIIRQDASRLELSLRTFLEQPNQLPKRKGDGRKKEDVISEN